MRLALPALSLLIFLPLFCQAQGDLPPSATYGAQIFNERCVLCHGPMGMGQGIIHASLKGYPDTNLHSNKHGTDINSLRHSIVYGGSTGEMHNSMPPWGDELLWSQVESLSIFLSLWYKDVNTASDMLRSNPASTRSSRTVGAALFKQRCVLCHGAFGRGDGKMARIIKDPPPFNLTLSQATDNYLSDIISKGGKKMGRSFRMPNFGDELSKSDINSLILHLKGLRKTNTQVSIVHN